jgi:ABC-type Zn uptake system ZnuABC Zn-binding protein ZnuA
MIAALSLAACTSSPAPASVAPITAAPATVPTVLAVETFLADIAQNVAGDRLKVDALIPIGVDPYAFEPTPQDVTRIAKSQVLIANGAGFEGWLKKC